MRRLAFLLGLGVLLAVASPAAASTTIPVKLTFTEPVVPAFKSGDALWFLKASAVRAR